MWPISVFLPFADFRRLFQWITISIIDNISKTFEGGFNSNVLRDLTFSGEYLWRMYLNINQFFCLLVMI